MHERSLEIKVLLSTKNLLGSISNWDMYLLLIYAGRLKQITCVHLSEKVNVMVALSMLKKLGLSADVAYNGMEAIKALQAKHYDLVYLTTFLFLKLF